MKASILGVLAVLFVVLSVPQGASAAVAIGYALIEEKQDAPSKTYSATFEVWSEDRAADAFVITPKTESKGLEILTPKKTLKGPFPKGKSMRHTVSARNATKETHSLTVHLLRKAGKREDTKLVTILVPPQ